MNVAASSRVADSEQLIATVRVRRQPLWLDLDQRVEVYFAGVDRPVFELGVHVVVGDRAVLYDDLIDDALHRATGVFVSQHRDQAAGVAANLAAPVIGCEWQTGAVE